MVPLFYRFCQAILYIVFKVWNRFELHGSNRLPDRNRGFILAANHVSYLDPPVLGGRIGRPLVFLAKEKLFHISILGKVITMLGALPIAGESEFKTLRTVTRALKSGHAVVIFPEGTRAAGESFLDPQPGVVFLAHMARVPIVPCFIDGTQKAWPRAKKIFCPAKIRVFIGNEMTFSEDASMSRNQNYSRFAEEIMNRIKDMKRLSQQEHANKALKREI